MLRRDFIVGMGAVLALAGCGGGGTSTTVAPEAVTSATSTGGGGSTQQVSGMVNLPTTGLQVVSALGPSTVSGQSFSTVTSTLGPQLIVAADGSGALQGLCVVLPGQAQVVVDATSTAMGILFLEPIFFTPDTGQAQAHMAQVRGWTEFTNLVTLVAGATSLDALALSGQLSPAVDAVMSRWASTLVESDSGPTSTTADGVVTLSNPSRRGLGVLRRELDAAGTVLSQTSLGLLAPYGTLRDPAGGRVTYVVQGIGYYDATHPNTVEIDPGALQASYSLTYVYNILQPLLELAAGQRFDALALQGILPAAALAQVAQALQTATVTDGSTVPPTDQSVQDVAAALELTPGVVDATTGSLTNLAKVITAGSYLAGLLFSVDVILKFKQHKDNPTQIPVATPIALTFIAAALLLLPSLLDMTGRAA